jgi:3-oxoadipate enol-lactonase
MNKSLTCLIRPWGHMHYRATGPAAAPAIVFANSLGTDLRMWDAVTALLPQYTCVGFDQRGHGLSATAPDDWTVEDLASDVLALMDHLGLQKAVIAGCSMGGMVAQATALAAPSRVRGLVLSNTAAQIGSAASWQARIDAIQSGGLASIADTIIDRWFPRAFLATPESHLWRTMLLRCDPTGYIAACRALGAADLRAEITTLRLPVLMIGGDLDPGTTPELMQDTADMIPGARLHILTGSGHLPAIDAPDKVAALIAAFAKALP